MQQRSALTLRESSFDLPHVDQRVDTPANIHVDVRAEDRPITGQGINLDFTDSGALKGWTAQRCFQISSNQFTWVK